MATETSLREYSARIADAIDNGRYATAVANAKHVLSQYPKCVSTYRLMARAALEAGQYDFAVDLLQRVLSCNPEDVIAWAGLSGVHDRRGEMEQAVAYLQRAVELTGGTGPVEAELRKLYSKRDGAEPKKVPLSPAALAWMYIRGDLLSKAIEQFREVLAQDPDRAEVSLGLAEALWRDNQRVEAAQVCLELLERLPYCLKANLILGEIWTSGGRDDGAAYLQRAEAVDPENKMAQELFGSASPLPPKEVYIAAPETPAAEGGELPGWLSGVVGPGGAQPVTDGEAEVLDIAAALEAQIEIPPWLEEVGLGNESPAALPQPEAAPAAPALPDWLAESGAVPAAEPPTPTGFGDVGLPAQAVPPTAAPGDDSDVAWLGDIEEEPAWLAGLGLEDIGDEELTAIDEADQSPEWLAGLGMNALAGDEEPSLPGEGEAPEWLEALRPEPATPAPAPEPPILDYAADTVAGAPPEAGAEAEPAAHFQPETEGELPEWLAAAAARAAVEPEPAAQPADEGLPEWLVQMGVKPVEEEEEAPGEDAALFDEQAMAWVEGLTARQEEGIPSAAEAEAALAELAGLTAAQDAADLEAGLGELATPDEAIAAEAFGWTLFGEQPSQAISVEQAPDDTTASLEPVGEPTGDAVLDWAALQEEAPLITEDTAVEPPLEVVGIVAPDESDIASEGEVFGWNLLGVEEEMAASAEPAVPVTPPPPPEMAAPAPEEAFGWTTFGEMGPSAGPPIPPERVAPAPVAQAPVGDQDWEDLLAAMPEGPAPALEEVAVEGAPGPSIPVEDQPRAIRAPESAAAPAEPAQFAANRAYLKQHPRDHEAWLSLARDLWRAELHEEALEAYGRLIKSGELLDKVIPDLEKRAKKPDDAAARRALGDAYMKAGRLDEALDIYRQALEGL